MEEYIEPCKQFIVTLEKDINVLENPKLLKEGDREKIKKRFDEDIRPNSNILYTTFHNNPNNKCFLAIYREYIERNMNYKSNKDALCYARTWSNGCGIPCKRKTEKNKYCHQHKNPQLGKITRKRPVKNIAGKELKWEKSAMLEEIVEKGDILKPIFKHYGEQGAGDLISSLNYLYNKSILKKIEELTLIKKKDIKLVEKIKELEDKTYSIMAEYTRFIRTEKNKKKRAELYSVYREKMIDMVETDLEMLYYLEQNPQLGSPKEPEYKVNDFIELVSGKYFNRFIENKVLICEDNIGKYILGQIYGKDKRVEYLKIDLSEISTSEFRLLKRGLVLDSKKLDPEYNLYNRYIDLIKGKQTPKKQKPKKQTPKKVKIHPKKRGSKEDK
jgi:hypothetical protein